MNDRAAFLAERRLGVGGSDVAAIVGLSPWTSPLDIYLDKRGEATEREGNEEAMYWGVVLEDVVATEYAKRTGHRVQRVNQMLRHPGRDWQLANIDRAVIAPEIAGNVRWRDGRLTTNRLLECKTANAFAADAWGEPGTDEIPEYYLTQTQWYLDVTSAEVCDVAVLIGGQDFRVYTIERDDDLIAALVAEADEFWRNTTQGIAPAPRSEADARRIWQAHRPGAEKIVSVDVARAVEELAAIKAQIGSDKKEGSLEYRAQQLRDLVCVAFGDAETITHMGRKLATWKANKASERTDWRGAVEFLRGVVSEAEINRAIAANTETHTGARVLRLNTKE